MVLLCYFRTKHAKLKVKCLKRTHVNVSGISLRGTEVVMLLAEEE